MYVCVSCVWVSCICVSWLIVEGKTLDAADLLRASNSKRKTVNTLISNARNNSNNKTWRNETTKRIVSNRNEANSMKTTANNVFAVLLLSNVVMYSY